MEQDDAAGRLQLLRLLAPGDDADDAAAAAGDDDGEPDGEGQALKLAAAAVRQLLKRKQPAAAGLAPPAACVVCMDAPCSVALSPCGHLALCVGCAAKDAVRKQCPVCRKRATRTIKIYHP